MGFSGFCISKCEVNCMSSKETIEHGSSSPSLREAMKVATKILKKIDGSTCYRCRGKEARILDVTVQRRGKSVVVHDQNGHEASVRLNPNRGNCLCATKNVSELAKCLIRQEVIPS